MRGPERAVREDLELLRQGGGLAQQVEAVRHPPLQRICMAEQRCHDWSPHDDLVLETRVEALPKDWDGPVELPLRVPYQPREGRSNGLDVGVPCYGRGAGTVRQYLVGAREFAQLGQRERKPAARGHVRQVGRPEPFELVPAFDGLDVLGEDRHGFWIPAQHVVTGPQVLAG